MKKISIFLCFTIISIVLLSGYRQTAITPSGTIRQHYKHRIDLFKNALLATHHIAESLDEKRIPELRQEYRKLRAAYKSCEYLLEILEPVLVKEYINGAPLPKLERKSFGLNILEPRGLQVLDELICGEEVVSSANEITSQLTGLISLMNNYPEDTKIYDRQVLEGMRLELIRIFTLGLTGFDVPASGNAIPDAITAVEIMQKDFLLYAETEKIKNGKAGKKVNDMFVSFIQYLKANNDFDRLDRLAVLTRYINPLYALLYDVQNTAGIEHSTETVVLNLLPPVNLHSRNLFDRSFLDPLKYTGLPPSLYSDSLVLLGRLLFFDPILSATNDRSCASCHKPEKGFADGLTMSEATGHSGTVSRNSPTLLNAVFSERFFHDMRADALEDQLEHVIISDKEFNTTVFELCNKLSRSSSYKKLFADCFPSYAENPVNKHTVAYAISAYVSSLISMNSPFDKYVRRESKTLPDNVKRGFNLFMGKAACGTCHFAPVFNGTVPPLYQESESEVLGVPQHPDSKQLVLDPDPGRAAAKLKESAPFYMHSFKTPTVRNIALTAPYMHNGSYQNLEKVVDFYNKGGGLGLGMQVPYQTLSADSLGLNDSEQKDLIAFLQSLTDTAGLTHSPVALPLFEHHPEWNNRKIGGLY